VQTKVLLAILVAGAVAAFVYLRTMGPRCGDQRCARGNYCLVNDTGGSPESVCTVLPDDCGLWPSCECIELPAGYECEDDLWGYVIVTMTPL